MAFLFWGLCTQIGLGQQQVFKINYSLKVEENSITAKRLNQDSISAEIVTNLLAGMQASSLDMEAYVNDSYALISAKFPNNDIQLQHKKTNNSYLLLPDHKEYIHSSPEQIDRQAAAFQISYIADRSKVIAGVPCKLAIIKPIDGEEIIDIQVWYSEQIPAFYWDDYSYLNQLPGAALSLGVQGLHIEATAISQVEIPQSRFEIPADYSLIKGDEAEYTENNDIELGEGYVAYYDSTASRYGLMKEGKVLTPASYSSIGEYIDGAFIVSNEEFLTGILDENAQVLVPLNYDIITYDSQLEAYMYCKDEAFSVMDKQGKRLWKNSYPYLAPFIDQFAIYGEDDKVGLVDSSGHIVVPANYEMIGQYNTEYFIVIEQDIFDLYDLKSQQKLFGGFKTLAFAEEKDLFIASKDAERFGYVDKQGHTVIPFNYSTASPFYDGKAMVTKFGTDEVSYINIKGETVAADEQ